MQMNAGQLIRRSVQRVASASPALFALALRLDEWRRAHSAHHRFDMSRHPFDLKHGVDTAGSVSGWLLDVGKRSDFQNNGYAGCHASCLRAALATIPDLSRFTFYDLGCGKGRALVQAAQYPFKAIVGVEIASTLCEVARRNAAIVASRKPGAPAIIVQEADAVANPPPEGPVVIFNYHSFAEDLFRSVLGRIVEKASGQEDVYFIYQNPAYGALVDASPVLRRWYAEFVPAEPDELAHQSEGGEATVVWRNKPGTWTSPHPRPDRPIEIVKPGWLARVR